MYVQSLNPWYTNIQTIWADKKLSQDTLFTAPTKNSVESSVLESLDYQARYDNTPVSVQVQSRTASLSTIVNGANASISNGINRVQTISNYLSGATDVLTQMEELRAQAADVNLTDADRQTLNEDFQNLVSKFDDFYANGTYGTDHVLQGGTYDAVVGIDGSATTISNANLDRQVLGLVNLDISTQAGADAAEDVITQASSNIEGQTLTAETDLNILNAFKEANSAYQDIATLANANILSANTIYQDLWKTIQALGRELNVSIPSQAENLDATIIDELIAKSTEKAQQATAQTTQTATSTTTTSPTSSSSSAAAASGSTASSATAAS